MPWNSLARIGRSTPEVLAATDPAPTLSTEGFACLGYKTATLNFVALTAANYDLEVWVLSEPDGTDWAQLNSFDPAAGGLVPVAQAGLAAGIALSVDCTGYARILARISAIPAIGNVTRIYTVSH